MLPIPSNLLSLDLQRALGAQCPPAAQVVGQGKQDSHRANLGQTTHSKLLQATLSRQGPPDWLTPERREQYRAVWRQGLEGALNYYRASPLRPPRDAQDVSLQQLQLPASVVNVAVPTTVLWGDADHALLPGLLDGLEAWVPGLQIHRHPAASHWIVHEQPAWVIEQLRAVLATL